MSHIISVLLLLGCFFFAVGTIGLIRLPDVFSRMHATTKCDTMGAGLIICGLILHQGITVFSFKLFIILSAIWLTSPTSAHIIAKSAQSGIKDKVKSHEEIL